MTAGCTVPIENFDRFKPVLVKASFSGTPLQPRTLRSSERNPTARCRSRRYRLILAMSHDPAVPAISSTQYIVTIYPQLLLNRRIALTEGELERGARRHTVQFDILFDRLRAAGDEENAYNQQNHACPHDT
ncbi:hypothetical protein [Thalassovita mangrovi]|uniref:hypothetical protein n=1 Tax=Thalassovita mangrovi TaxID=2692236 RepID=UPI001367CD1E|nr:hypothetical protein [Thalassovita mangrovi]